MKRKIDLTKEEVELDDGKLIDYNRLESNIIKADNDEWRKIGTDDLKFGDKIYEYIKSQLTI